MNAVVEIGVIKQHLIDPEICIRCNTCEATCPVGAVTHDSRNYVVDFAKCNGCNACIPPCPTGAIDHWHQVRKAARGAVAASGRAPPALDSRLPARSAQESRGPVGVGTGGPGFASK